MQQYLLSVHHVGSPRMPEGAELNRVMKAVDEFNAEVQQAGAWVFAGGLHPIEASTTVDATGAEVIIKDGPFAETKEHLGGFWIILAPDLDAALEWARKGSLACAGPVEVRPFADDPGVDAAREQ